MNNNDIINKIKQLNFNEIVDEYVLFKIKEEFEGYYGINKDKNFVFVLESKAPNVTTISQSTNELKLIFNAKCKMKIENEYKNKIVHVLTCLSKEDDELKAFIALSRAFSNTMKENSNPYILNELFSSLVNLFNNKNKLSEQELEGFFAELYVIQYFYKKNIDLLKYWQRKERMKFDFSINDIKRIEVKSTLNDNRIHRFRHEQLLSDLYDILVISILLRESDQGLSLYDLIAYIQEIAQNQYNVLLYIKNFIKNASDEQLKNIRYDEIYLKNNFKIYNSKEIPKFNQKSPDGVTKTEYDSDLTSSINMSEEEFQEWISDI